MIGITLQSFRYRLDFFFAWRLIRNEKKSLVDNVIWQTMYLFSVLFIFHFTFCVSFIKVRPEIKEDIAVRQGFSRTGSGVQNPEITIFK